MFKHYHLKWYFIVTVLLSSATTLSLGLRENLGSVRWWEYFQYMLQLSITLIICWFIHGFFLLNKVTWANNSSKHVVSNALATVLTFVVVFGLYQILPETRLNNSGVGYNSLSDCVIHLIGAFLASVVTYVVFYSIHTSTALQTSRLENEILEQAHLRAQLMSLQQQVSPHFLFNSLSTLKTLTREKPTKEFIVELATVYRYVLSFNQHHLTPLQEELAFVSSYLYIIKARYEDSFHVTVSVAPEHLNLMVPPLSVQLLLENAIKHNVISPDRPLDITIKTDLSPCLIVTNTLQPKKNAEEGTGTGLNNIRERYRLMSGKTISVNDQHGYFTVTLPLLKP